jgi:hypothetical protein
MASFRNNDGSNIGIVVIERSIYKRTMYTQLSPVIIFTIDPNNSIQINIPSFVVVIYGLDIWNSGDFQVLKVSVTNVLI